MRNLTLEAVLFLTLILLLPTKGDCELSTESKNLFRRAMELNERGDYGRALNYFMKSYKLSPEILAEDDNGLLEKATKFLRAKAEKEDGSSETHFQLAELLLLRGIENEGLEHYEKVVELSPSGPLAVLARSEIDRLKARMKADQAQRSSSGNDGDGSSGSTSQSNTSRSRGMNNAKVNQLKNRIQRLQEQVASLQRQLEKQKRAVEAEREKNSSVKKELEELQKKSKRWKLYYHLYMRDLGRSN